MTTYRDIRKEILLELFNSTSNGWTDLKPKIKSLDLTRKEIIDLFSVLEHDGIIKSDNQWGQIKITSAGTTPSIDELQFYFRLTPKGEDLVINRYQPKQPIQMTDNQKIHKMLEYIFSLPNNTSSIDTHKIAIDLPLADINVAARQLITNEDAKDCTTKDNIQTNSVGLLITQATKDAFETKKYIKTYQYDSGQFNISTGDIHIGDNFQDSSFRYFKSKITKNSINPQVKPKNKLLKWFLKWWWAVIVPLGLIVAGLVIENKWFN